VQAFVFPNPASSYVDVSFNSSKQGNYSITVYVLQGTLLLQKSGAGTVGYHSVRVDIGSLANGMYLVKLATGNQSYLSKLVKH
jgi:hypothetical protein